MKWLSTFSDPDAEFRVLDINGDGLVTRAEMVVAVAPFVAGGCGKTRLTYSIKAYTLDV